MRAAVLSGKKMYQVVSVLNGLVLDVSGCFTGNGANVQVYKSNGTKAQFWSLTKCVAVVKDGAYVIVSTLPGGRVVDVSGASPDNGAAVQTYSSNGTLAQQFALSYDKNSGYYTITNYASGRVVDVQNGSASQSTPVQQFASNNSRAQKWHIVKNSNGTYTFLSAINGLALDIPGAKAANGVQLQQYGRNNTKAQQFALRAANPMVAGGTVTIRSGANTYLVADVPGATTASGSGLQLYASNGTFAQKYVLTKQKDGTFTIRSAVSGLYLAAASNGVVSQQKSGNKSLAYYWSIAPTARGHFTIIPVGKKDLSLSSNGKASSGLELKLASASWLSSSWNFLPVPLINNGLYSLFSVKNQNLVVDVKNAWFGNGTNVQLFQANNSNAQKFFIRNIGGEQYIITSAWAGKNVEVKYANASSGANVWIYDQNGTKAQKWTAAWDGSGGFVFKSALGSFAMSVPGSIQNGSNVALRAYDPSNTNQRFRLGLTSWNSLSESERIAVLDSIAGGGLNTFKSVNALSSSTLGQLRNAIARYENNGKSVGFLMMDLKTGAGVSYGIDNKYYSASTIKGPYVIAANKYAPWTLNAYRNAMYNTINVSSNEDYAYIRNSIGSWPLQNLINETHAWDFSWGTHYVYYGARDLAKLWVGMGEYLMNDRSSNAEWCRNVFGSNEWITSRPTLGKKVYAKSGWIYGSGAVHNEGCIVMDGDNPYLMVVMTTQSPENTSNMSNLMRVLDRAHGELVW